MLFRVDLREQNNTALAVSLIISNLSFDFSHLQIALRNHCRTVAISFEILSIGYFWEHRAKVRIGNPC